MTRFVVCVDVIGDDNLSEAYGKMTKALVTLPEDIQWETTDEAFQDDGTEIDPEDLQKARMDHFGRQMRAQHNPCALTLTVTGSPKEVEDFEDQNLQPYTMGAGRPTPCKTCGGEQPDLVPGDNPGEVVLVKESTHHEYGVDGQTPYKPPK